MVEMDDVIAVGNLGEVERLMLAAQTDEAFLLAQGAKGLVSAKNFGVAQDDQFARGPDEAAQKRPDKKGDGFQRNLRLDENFLETALFALVVAKNRDFPLLGEPVAQMIQEKIAPVFLEDEVAARRVQKIVRKKIPAQDEKWLHPPPFPNRST